MRRIRAALVRLVGVFSKTKHDREFADEIESHLQLHIEDNLRAGFPPDEARRRALVRFGGIDLAKEAYRDRVGIPTIETLIQDLRFGVRLLIRQSGFALVAIVTLALGIGATTAMFTIVDAVMLRPFPFTEPEQLVVVWETNPERGIHTFTGSAANYVDWQQSTTMFADLGAWELRNDNRTDGAQPEQVMGAVASSTFFGALQIRPEIGRFFGAEEDRPAAFPNAAAASGSRVGASDAAAASGSGVAVLGYEYWQRAFNADPAVVGQAVVLNGESHTIVGVMPALRAPFKADIWRPLAADVATLDRGDHSLMVVGRLAPRQSMAQAEAELQTIAARLASTYPESNRGWSVRVESLFDALIVDTTRRSMVILLAAVGLLLLIACVNVANLVLTRSTSRFREMSLRLALGAARGRLVRQLLTESALLAAAGAVVGLLIAAWGLRLVQWLYPADLLGLAEAQIDPYALGFAVFVSFGTTLIVGLLPAIQLSRIAFPGGLKQVSRISSDAPRTERMRQAFVVAEIALALMLLIGAGLLLRSVDRLRHAPLGFAPERVLTAKIGLYGEQYESLSRYAGLVERVLGELETRPGIAAAGIASSVPLGGGYTVMQVRLGADAGTFAAGAVQAHWRVIGGDYFSAVGIPQQLGRSFRDADDHRVPRVTIISDALAQQLWPNQDPVGRRMLVGDSGRPYEVVGVGRTRLTALGQEPEAAMYFHYRQFSWPSMTLALRAVGDPGDLAGTVRAAVSAVDPQQPVFEVHRMTELVDRAAAAPQMNAALLTLFAVLALTLSAIGVYGVMSYAAAQRTGEIGLRLALGAPPRAVLALVWRNGLALTALGLGIGCAGALVTGRALGSLLYEVSALDPIAYAMSTAVMLCVGLGACYIPARRAMRVDPVVALRQEG